MTTNEGVQPNFGCTSSDRKYICTLPKGHEPAMHEAHGAPGIILHSWPVQPSGNTPEPKFKVGQVVMYDRSRSAKPPIPFVIKEVLSEDTGTYYRFDSKNCLAEPMLRALTSEESGVVAASSKEATPKCPTCDKPLTRVVQESNSPLNHDQWASTIAGDWVCTCHNNFRGNKPYAYFWDHEFTAACPVCGRSNLENAKLANSSMCTNRWHMTTQPGAEATPSKEEEK